MRPMSPQACGKPEHAEQEGAVVAGKAVDSVFTVPVDEPGRRDSPLRFASGGLGAVTNVVALLADGFGYQADPCAKRFGGPGTGLAATPRSACLTIGPCLLPTIQIGFLP